jgi:hypothetical protein
MREQRVIPVTLLKTRHFMRYAGLLRGSGNTPKTENARKKAR